MFQQIFELLREGDIYMWAIVITSVVGLAIVVERSFVLLSAHNIKKDELLNHINSQILQGHLEKAIATCSQVKNPLTNIVRSGLMSVANNGGPDEVQTAMDAVALREVPRLERRIGLLATLSNIATLLGLLGTVAGLIAAFVSVADLPPDQKAKALAGAIGLAMNTTALGLIVAIPLLGAFGWLNSKAQDIIDEMQEASVATLNFVLANRAKLRENSAHIKSI